MSTRRFWSGLIALGVLITVQGCTGAADNRGAVTGGPSTGPSEDPPHPVSLQTLIAKKYDGRQLRVGRVLARTSDYARYFVTYRSGKLTISGIMNVPDGNGPFPVVILNHGYIDPAIYTNGRGLAGEQ